MIESDTLSHNLHHIKKLHFSKTFLPNHPLCICAPFEHTTNPANDIYVILWQKGVKNCFCPIFVSMFNLSSHRRNMRKTGRQAHLKCVWMCIKMICLFSECEICVRMRIVLFVERVCLAVHYIS